MLQRESSIFSTVYFFSVAMSKSRGGKKASAPVAAALLNCHNCGAPEAPLRCGRCRHVSYCNRVCQRAAWEGHKVTCRTPTLKDSPHESHGAVAMESDSVAMRLFDSDDVLKALEAAARSDNLGDFQPVCLALVHSFSDESGAPPPRHAAHVADGIMRFFSGPIRSAAITASALQVLFNVQTRYPRTMADAALASPGTLLNVTRRFVKDSTVTSQSLGLWLQMTSKGSCAAGELAAAFAASGGLPLLVQVLEWYLAPANGVSKGDTLIQLTISAPLGLANALILRAPGTASELASLGIVRFAVLAVAALDRSCEIFVAISYLEAMCALIGNLHTLPGQIDAAMNAGALSALLTWLPAVIESSCLSIAHQVVMTFGRLFTGPRTTVPGEHELANGAVAAALLCALKSANKGPPSKEASAVALPILHMIQYVVSSDEAVVPGLRADGVLRVVAAAEAKFAPKLGEISRVAEAIRALMA